MQPEDSFLDSIKFSFEELSEWLLDHFSDAKSYVESTEFYNSAATAFQSAKEYLLINPNKVIVMSIPFVAMLVWTYQKKHKTESKPKKIKEGLFPTISKSFASDEEGIISGGSYNEQPSTATRITEDFPPVKTVPIKQKRLAETYKKSTIIMDSPEHEEDTSDQIFFAVYRQYAARSNEL